MAADTKKWGWRWIVAAVSTGGEIALLDPAGASRKKEVRLGEASRIEDPGLAGVSGAILGACGLSAGPGGLGRGVACVAHVDMCHACRRRDHMAMIQVRNVPDTLHRTLKARAAQAGLSLSDYLLRELAAVAARPTPEELIERIRGRTKIRGKLDSARMVRAEREGRR